MITEIIIYLLLGYIVIWPLHNSRVVSSIINFTTSPVLILCGIAYLYLSLRFLVVVSEAILYLTGIL